MCERERERASVCVRVCVCFIHGECHYGTKVLAFDARGKLDQVYLQLAVCITRFGVPAIILHEQQKGKAYQVISTKVNDI